MSKYNLSTIEGQKRIMKEFWWRDHGCLRHLYQNAHEIAQNVWRSNQPSPSQLKKWKEKGIKTIINLRGDDENAHTILEKSACEALGLNLVFVRLSSRVAPSRATLNELESAFRNAQYPILMHCKSGADRAGFAASFYKYVIEGATIECAKQQLSYKYLHCQWGKTGILSHFWRKFAQFKSKTGASFNEWVNNYYDCNSLYNDFKPIFLGIWISDIVLQRE
jgi:protein tyrosine/serine phosphatase